MGRRLVDCLSVNPDSSLSFVARHLQIGILAGDDQHLRFVGLFLDSAQCGQHSAGQPTVVPPEPSLSLGGDLAREFPHRVSPRGEFEIRVHVVADLLLAVAEGRLNVPALVAAVDSL